VCGAWDEPAINYGKLIGDVRHMLDVQGQHGNWDCDPYMHGLYNGIEFALSIVERREPKFRDAPDTWLADKRVKRTFSETHGIGRSLDT
jgi:hypothetical protein